MKVFRDLKEIPADLGCTVLSIGNFDGVHRAHQHVLRENVRIAQELWAKSMVVTFDPHPVRVLRPDVPKRMITPLPIKLRLFERLGVYGVLVLTFNQELSQMTPRRFAEDVLLKKLCVKEIHEGSNFHFGHHAEGNVHKLAEIGRELGFKVHIYPQRYFRGEHVSSSRIRQLIVEGNMTMARHLLGRAFSIVHRAERGRGVGSRYTVPTINLGEYNELVPAHGVYITCTRVGDEWFDSVTNVGRRPTFGEQAFAIETHLLDFHPVELNDDTEVEVSFLQRIRPEIKFGSIDELREQILKDVHKANRYFALAEALRAKIHL